MAASGGKAQPWPDSACDVQSQTQGGPRAGRWSVGTRWWFGPVSEVSVAVANRLGGFGVRAAGCWPASDIRAPAQARGDGMLGGSGPCVNGSEEPASASPLFSLDTSPTARPGQPWDFPRGGCQRGRRLPLPSRAGLRPPRGSWPSGSSRRPEPPHPRSGARPTRASRPAGLGRKVTKSPL